MLVNEEKIHKPETLSPSPNPTNARPFDAVVILILFMMTVATNIRVFHLITSTPRRRLRPASILVAHLSVVLILLMFILFIYVMEKWDIWHSGGPGFCQLLTLSRNTVYNVFPLNISGIVYEIMRSFRVTRGRFLYLRAISLMWIVAGAGNILTLFTVTHEEEIGHVLGKCKQVPLFGTVALTIVYEIFRFTFFHLTVGGYMIHEMFLIRSKIRYLRISKPLQTTQMQQKARRVQFIYFHSIVFILLWIPAGFLLLLYKVLSRSGVAIVPVKFYMKIVASVSFPFFMLSPLIYVGLIEGVSLSQFCCGMGTSNPSGGESQETGGSTIGGNTENLASIEDAGNAPPLIPVLSQAEVETRFVFSPIENKILVKSEIVKKDEKVQSIKCPNIFALEGASTSRALPIITIGYQEPRLSSKLNQKMYKETLL